MSQLEKASLGFGKGPRWRGLEGVWGSGFPLRIEAWGVLRRVRGGEAQGGHLRTCFSLLLFLGKARSWRALDLLGAQNAQEHVQGSDKSCRKESWMTLFQPAAYPTQK